MLPLRSSLQGRRSKWLPSLPCPALTPARGNLSTQGAPSGPEKEKNTREGWGNNKNRVCVPHCALHQSAGGTASTGLPPRPNHQAVASRWNKYIKLWGIIKMTDDWVSSEIQHY
ncbi:hypothetical protein INR49_004027 [Xyrichtys novacula]|uniref:Uncharacterized protein n=1 Tax=Xyrichtys novacula TaxID=13765 RepID=A0AAV1ELS7_XYRNO|nr:hypothetical protein INR49_004027 [Xyrichtys novacula]